MKYLFSTLLICLFTLTSFGQSSPFALQASSGNTGLNEITLQAYPTENFRANIGYTTNNSMGSYFLAGVGYDIEIFDNVNLLDINKFIDLNANGLLGETYTDEIISGKEITPAIDTSVGVALQYRFLKIGTSYHYLLGIANHYWSPVNLSLRF